MTSCAIAAAAGLLLAAAAHPSSAASVLTGRVLFSGLGVPGATVTALRDRETLTTSSGDDGVFRFAAVEDGTWTVRVEMRGFLPSTRDVVVPVAGEPPTWTLAMRTYEEIVGRPSPQPVTEPDAEPQTDIASALDAGILNGSVNNGGATPFAQPRAFGNNRPRSGPPYSGALSAVLGNSAWNARPFSFGGPGLPPPSYGDVQVGFTIAGPLRIPWLVKNGPQTVVNYQRGVLHTTSTQSAVVPTAAQRGGDFSASASGPRDPETGLPFPGAVIPSNRISPQASALLAYYPIGNLPTVTATGANHQAALVTATTQDTLQFGLTKAVGRPSTLGGTFAFQRTVANSVSLFEFADVVRQSSFNAALNWTRRVNSRLSVRAGYRFARSGATAIPFFAHRTNVSGDAGIAGNDQQPENWGPPSLSFPDVAGLRDADYQRTIGRTHASGGEASIKRGRHNLTLGGDVRWHAIDVSSQSDPRGSLSFTGFATGNAFADFLLGIPATSTLGFGDAATHLRGASSDAYVTDDWRISSLTMNLGVRWEYESPLTTLLRPDRRGLEPRLAISWRPLAGTSLVLRASYGVYRNPGVYQPLAILLSQQPPAARTLSIQNRPQTPLTLASPFPATVPSAKTFAVDPDFRAGAADVWQLSAQRDFPASLTVIVAYLGARGSHLMQAALPNTYPAGAENPCPACASGYVNVTSKGTSLRNAAQLTLRRRLHNGLTATGQYTLAKSTDDAATFSNTAVKPASLSIAQDWRDLAAERGPSSFDQRHLVSGQFQYTTGVGAAGGTLVDGTWGRLFKDWTIATQLNAGSGLPFTPIAFVAVPGSGVAGVRPRLTGGAPEPAPRGAYANAARFATPLPGTWGNAGRNSIRGPSQFSLDANVARVFRLRGRVNLEWRLAAANVLNRVTFATINTIITSPQFGRPTIANPMRRLQSTLRLRF